MTGCKAEFQNFVKRMLHTGEALGRVVVFVVNVKIAIANRITCFLRQKVVIDKRLCGLACKLHHHACRRVSVHIGVLSGYFIIFSLDNLQKHVTGLGATGNAALVAVGNISFGNFLARAVHQFHFNAVLDFFHTHPLLSCDPYAIRNFLYQRFVFASLCLQHSLAYCCLDFFFVIADHSTISLYYYLYHGGVCFYFWQR